MLTEQVTPEPTLAGTLAEYRASRETGAPLEKKVEPPASGEELEENAAGEGTAEHTEQQADTPGAEPEPARKKGGFQRTIEKQRQEIEGLKKQLAGKPAGTSAALEPEPEPEPAPPVSGFAALKPTLDQFDSLEAFSEALTDWKLDKREFDKQQAAAQTAAQAEADQLVNDWNTRQSAAKERHADYDDVIAAVDDVQLHPVQQRAIMESEFGPELAYALASDPKELQRIVGLPPLAFAREIGKLEARLSAQAAPAEPEPEPKVSAAPRPFKPVGAARGAAAGTVDVGKISLSDYRRARELGKVA
jgi:hypothetical protein